MKGLLLTYIKPTGNWFRYLLESAIAIVGIFAVTGTIYMFHLSQFIPTVSLICLLIVLILVHRHRLAAAILAMFIALAVIDFFLIEPLYTFAIARDEDKLTMLIFLLTTITASFLLFGLHQRLEEAKQREYEATILLELESYKRAEEVSRRERETQALYELARAINDEKELESQLKLIAHAIVQTFSPRVYHCTLILPDINGKLSLLIGAPQPMTLTELLPDEEKIITWVMTNGRSMGLFHEAIVTQRHGTYIRRVFARQTAKDQTIYYYTRVLPLKAGQQVIGVARLLVENPSEPQLFAIEQSIYTESSPSHSRTESLRRFLDLAVSVIERARLQQESMAVELLRRTDELRASLLSSVSHDLRSPLASIKLLASGLRQVNTEWQIETVQSYALDIERIVDRLDGMVSNLLDMSRIEKGILHPKKELYPIDALIHNMLECMQPLLQSRSVQLDIPEDLPAVELDDVQIGQVLANLIENAVHHTPAESPIQISAKVEGQRILVSVADRGPGIPQFELERIFEKFHAVQRQTIHGGVGHAGSGIGLFVCRGLIEAHGGYIWAKNRAGGGAIFLFTLPLPQNEAKE